MAPKDVHVLIPGTYKYAILHNERDFPDGTNEDFKIERLSWIIWAQSNRTNHYKQRTFSSSSQRDVAEGKVRFEIQEKLDLLLLEVATWKAQEVMQEVLKEQRLAFA